jgi:hypothetical protein
MHRLVNAVAYKVTDSRAAQLHLPLLPGHRRVTHPHTDSSGGSLSTNLFIFHASWVSLDGFRVADLSQP